MFVQKFFSTAVFHPWESPMLSQMYCIQERISFH
uniref:Uncharacterized protein n=1 Tax=Anguilla anguilla TaxID=7936 RepID=A0A0E9UUL9_ANGAN